MRKCSFIKLKLLLFVAISLLTLCYYGRGTASVVKVAILPFQMNAGEDIEYINRGIRDMIASRITYTTHITVVEQDLLGNTLSKTLPGKLTKKEIQEIGSRLGVDYIVFGSITKIGSNMSIDINILNVSQGKIIKPAFIQITGLDELIPKMKNLAHEIKDTITTELSSLPPETTVQPSEAVKTLLKEEKKLDEALLEKIKEEMKREILAELRKEGMAKAPVQQLASVDQEHLKEELTEEIMVKLRERDIGYGTAHSSKDLGSAEGRILYSGKGLEGCRVKLVRMTRYGILSKIFQDYSFLDTEFETITDKDGIYRFADLPTGFYKLKWELPGDKGWIRRLKLKPDVTIEEGKKSVLKNVEANMRLVPL